MWQGEKLRERMNTLRRLAEKFPNGYAGQQARRELEELEATFRAPTAINLEPIQ